MTIKKATDEVLKSIKDGELFTQTALLERGWTKKLIKELLPEPELYTNPRFSSGHPMKVWAWSDVDGGENTDEFKEWIRSKNENGN